MTVGPGNSAPENPEFATVVQRAGAIAAWRFADEAHAGQLRKANQAPYIHHPERVAQLTAEHGGDEAMVAAALLHDVLEDSPVEAEQLREPFGEDVTGLVVALSDDRAIDDYERRKAALREQVREAGRRAALIYACDKLANCQDARSAFSEIGADGLAERLGITLDLRVRIWRDDLAMCADLLGEHELVAALAAELDGFERDCADAAGR